MIEVWKAIPRLNGYEASNLGRIRSIDRVIEGISRWDISSTRIYNQPGKIISLIDNGNGYLYFTSSIKGKRKNYYVHRAIAEAFLDNINLYDEINHKDGNKKNNNIENLEWCSHLQNLEHASINNLIRKGEQKPNAIKIINKSSGLIFNTIREAADFYNIKYGLLKEALRRKVIRRKAIYNDLILLKDYIN